MSEEKNIEDLEEAPLNSFEIIDKEHSKKILARYENKFLFHEEKGIIKILSFYTKDYKKSSGSLFSKKVVEKVKVLTSIEIETTDDLLDKATFYLEERLDYIMLKKFPKWENMYKKIEKQLKILKDK